MSVSRIMARVYGRHSAVKESVRSESPTGNEAARVLEDHPHFHTQGGTIDVLDFLPMPGT